MILLKRRFPFGLGQFAAAVYEGPARCFTLVLWIGRGVGQHKSLAIPLMDASPSFTGAGRWSW